MLIIILNYNVQGAGVSGTTNSLPRLPSTTILSMYIFNFTSCFRCSIFYCAILYVVNFKIKIKITRYTFYAERGYLPHCSTNDSLTRQQCSQGLGPWTPLGALPPDPHFLALRARFPFCRLSEQRPL